MHCALIIMFWVKNNNQKEEKNRLGPTPNKAKYIRIGANGSLYIHDQAH